MSGIEYLHTWLGEQKQHIQGRVPWYESKLMIGYQAIGEEEGFNVWSDDGFHNLADDWEKADWSVVAGICFCTFLCRVGMFADFQAYGRWPWLNERVNRAERWWAGAEEQVYRTRGLIQSGPVAESELRFDSKLSTLSEEKDTESRDRWVWLRKVTLMTTLHILGILSTSFMR